MVSWSLERRVRTEQFNGGGAVSAIYIWHHPPMGPARSAATRDGTGLRLRLQKRPPRQVPGGSRDAASFASAAMLRDRARETDDADRRRVLLTLAEDCDQLAADLEGDGALEVG